jgi:HlyD family secretion protein
LIPYDIFIEWKKGVKENMKKKFLIGGAIVLLVVAVFFIWQPFAPKAQAANPGQPVILKKGNLLDAVLVSGTVKSSSAENVYSTVTMYPVKKVYVEVGDKVKAGEVLVQLDTASLELDIKQTELNIKNAEEALKNESSSNSYNLQSALNNVNSASLELENSKTNLEQIKVLAASGASSQNELTQAENALKRAQLSYDNAKVALENIQSKNLINTRNNIEIQKIALEKQKKVLRDTKITAPIGGTVTLVNVKENGTAAGLLFVVEDTENLVVATSIGEYDVSRIKLGQEVLIKTDSTGNREFLGAVSKIAPTAAKDASGSTGSSSNVAFDSEITVKEKDPNIKIGMNVRLTIKINEKKDVYFVPYDAVMKEGDGSRWIYAQQELQKEGKLQTETRKLPVQTGMETDMYVEITGPELRDGLVIQTGAQKAVQ